MFRLFNEKDVKKLVLRLKEEYDGVLARQRAAAEELKEENRQLRARVLELEGERGSVGEAIISAQKAGVRIREESAREAENERKELALLAEKCRLMLDRLQKKYPDEEDVAAFQAFTDELETRLGGGAEDYVFDMEEVLSPKQPLDLEKLCKDLGLMEDDE